MWRCSGSDEGPESDEYHELYERREASPREIEPEPYVERRRAPAQNLDRVVPLAQRQRVDEAAVALTSLEHFGEGVGVLRYRISCVTSVFEGGHGCGGIPGPELVVRD